MTRFSLRTMATCILAATILGFAATPLSAAVRPTVKRVALVPFTGPSGAADELLERVTETTELTPELAVVDQDQVRQTLRNPQANLEESEARRLVAQNLGISAWIEGAVEGKRRRWKATLRAVNAADGRLLNEVSWTRPTKAELLASYRSSLNQTHRAIVEDGHVPPSTESAALPTATTQHSGAATSHGSAPQSAPSALSATTVAPPEEPQRSGRQDAPTAGTWLVMSPFAGVFSRNLTYNPRRFPSFTPFRLPAAMALGLDIHVYPLARVLGSTAPQLGLDVRGLVLVGLRTQDATQKEYATEAFDLRAGLRLRIPIGMHDVSLVASYELQRFNIYDEANTEQPSYPDTNYRVVRVAIEGRVSLISRLSFHPHLAWLYVLSAGSIATRQWLGTVSAAGVEGGFAVTYDLSRQVAVRAGFEVRNYVFAYNSLVNPLGSGLATDRSWTIFGGLSWSLR